MTLTATESRDSLDRGFWQVRERASNVLDYAALALIGVLTVLIATGAPLAVKEVALLAFVAYVPGRAVTTHWPSLKGPLLAVTTVALGVSLSTLLAAVILWLHWWYPTTLFIVEAAACAASLVVGLGSRSGWRFTPAAPTSAGAGRPERHLEWQPFGPDLMLPAALVLWGIGVSAVQIARVDQWGLLPALPLPFYAGLALLVVSVVWLLSRPQLSGPRLVLHLVALVLVIAGTSALVYPAPRYPWVYKHIGVVQYLNLHGAVNQTVDIYQNWPGFFALVAWFDRVIGVSSPIQFAAWTETVVMLASCLAIYAAARQLHLTERERWTGLFIFVVASWVDQIYFSPQALGYALSLFVIALVLSWFQDDRSYGWMGSAARRLQPVKRLVMYRRAAAGGEPGGAVPGVTGGPVAPPAHRRAAMVAVLLIFGVLVFVHQLSPYVVALQVTVLVALGRVRPRWLAPLLWLMALAYLAPRFVYVNNTYGLLAGLGSFFSNLQTSATGLHRPYELGVRVAAYAAYAITFIVWCAACVAVVRRARAQRPTMTLSVLAFSPVITFFLTNYGGEATYRVYFFSVPWVALLAASAIAREPSAEPAERSARRRLMTVLPVGVVLVTLTALILPAYFGNDELYLIPPGEVTAADYFYTHAPVGSALVLAAEDFPSQISGRYNLYPDNQTDPDPTLLDSPQLGDYHQLGKQSLPAVAADLRQFSDGDRHDVFVAFAASGFAAAGGYNLAPPGALEKLEAAMSQSPQWSVFYRNPTTTIFLYHPQVTGRS